MATPGQSLDRAAVATAATPASATNRPAAASPWVAARRRFSRSISGVAGTAVLLILLLAAIFAAFISPYDPVKQDFRVERDPPSLAHPMGVDELGRDILSRVIWGARVSLQAGAMAATIALVIGSTLGMLAAFYGGAADTIIMRSMD